MAIYEYFCPTCRNKFEQRRSMSQATAPVKCVEGHAAERSISVFAMSRSGGEVSIAEMPSGGGCCGGGGCACGSNN